MTISYAATPPPELKTVSLESLVSDNPEIQYKETNRLREMCEADGFFYLSDHGVPRSLANRIMKSSREFFALPVDVKEKWAQDKQVFFPRTLRGYAKMGVEQLNPQREADLKETFEFGPDRPLEPGKPFTGPTVAPLDDEVPDFAKSNMEFVNIVVRNIAPKLAKAIATSLGLEESFFLKDLTEDEMMVTERIAHYPPHTGGCGRHTDSTLFTIVLHEAQKSGTPSLKIFSDGRWLNMQTHADLLTVNVGNILQRWSNQRFVSTPHLVVHDGDTDRISAPVFVYPNYNARMTPLGKKEGEDTIVAGEVYLNDLLDIWEKDNGAGFWSSSCSGKGCNCWKCT